MRLINKRTYIDTQDPEVRLEYEMNERTQALKDFTIKVIVTETFSYYNKKTNNLIYQQILDSEKGTLNYWYKYDKNGNKISEETDTTETTHKYSNTNKLLYTKTVYIPDGSSEEEWYEYNDKDLLVKYKDNEGCEINYKYDKNNNLLEETKYVILDGECEQCDSVKYSYDKDNNCISKIQERNGKTTQEEYWGYNNDGDVISYAVYTDETE